MHLNNSLVILLELFLSIIPSLTVNFGLLVFSISNVNMIMDTKLHTTNHLHNAMKLNKVIKCNAKNKSNEPAHLISVLIAVSRNEGSC